MEMKRALRMAARACSVELFPISSVPIPISHYVTSISIHSIDSVPIPSIDLIPILIVIAFAFAFAFAFRKEISLWPESDSQGPATEEKLPVLH